VQAIMGETTTTAEAPSPLEAQPTDREEPERTAGQSWPYAASALSYLVLPFAIGAVAAPATATALLLAWLPAAALVLGVLDARVFRRTWAFPVLTGAFCWLAMLLYSDPGTWIYAVGAALVCRLGSLLGGARTGRA